MIKGLAALPLLFSPVVHSLAKRSTPVSVSDFDYDTWGRVIWKKDGLPFYAKRNNPTQDFQDAWKRVQPIRSAWEEKRKNRKTDVNKGIEATNLIRDYTFRFVNKCVSGTIWILDYELPKKKNEYPTKFFFGTNAHVAEWMIFDSNNPYQQNPSILYVKHPNLEYLEKQT